MSISGFYSTARIFFASFFVAITKKEDEKRAFIALSSERP